MGSRRPRVGYLAPASFETTLIELSRMLPPDVSLVATTLRVNRISRDELEAEAHQIETAARALGKVGADVVALSGAPMAYMAGPGSDLRLAALAAAASDRPAFFSITAVQEALRHLGATRIAIASPFTDEVNEPMRAFFAAAGFEVVSLVGGTYHTNVELRRVPAYIPYQFGRRALLSAVGAQALFITCSGWATQPSIEPLEAEFGLPVVTQIQCTAWRALDILGVSQRVPHTGRLLSVTPAAQPARDVARVA